jgi:hypothetical protein
MIAREKDSGFGWKFEDFKFRAAFHRLLLTVVASRLWKDHLKNDLRSDQDHRQKIDLRSRSRSRF